MRHRWLVACVGGIALSWGGQGLADPLDDQLAIESAQALASLAASLPAPPAAPPGETPPVDLIELADALDTLAGEIYAGRPKVETYPLFRRIALQRHRLVQEAHEGKIPMTEGELETAGALFGDLVAYFESREEEQ